MNDLAESLRGLKSPIELFDLVQEKPPSWASATVMKALYAIEPTAEERTFWDRITRRSWFKRLFSKKSTWPLAAVLFVVLCLGRRSFKSHFFLAWILIWEALCGRHEDHVAAGTRCYFVEIAPRRAQAKESILAIRAGLDRLAPLGVRYSFRSQGDGAEIVIEQPACRAERVISVMTASDVSIRGFAIAVLAFEEAGHFNADATLTRTLADIEEAAGPAQLQFPNAKRIFVGTKGQPRGVFYDMVEKGKGVPDGGAVALAETYVMNPNISEAKCRAEAKSHQHFLQENAVARWGYAGESFIESDDVSACVDHKLCPGRPRPGFFSIAVDQAQSGSDFCVLGVFSNHYVGTTTVRHVVVEHIEGHRAKDFPGGVIPIKWIAERAAALSRLWGNARIRYDQWARVELQAALKEAGVRTHEMAAMNPSAQTPRWILVRDMVRGRRLHIPDDEVLKNHLSNLTAIELASGMLKVEGKGHDDYADVVALGVEDAVKLMPTGGDVEWEISPLHWVETPCNMTGGEKRWFRRLADGTKEILEPPIDAPEFEDYATDMLAQGKSTTRIEEWLASRPDVAERFRT